MGYFVNESIALGDRKSAQYGLSFILNSAVRLTI